MYDDNGITRMSIFEENKNIQPWHRHCIFQQLLQSLQGQLNDTTIISVEVVSFAESSSGDVIADYNVTINPLSNVNDADLVDALVASLVDGMDIVSSDGTTLTIVTDSIGFQG